MKKDIIEINEADNTLRTFILFQQTTRVVSKYQDSHLNKDLGLSTIKFIVLMAFYYNPSACVTASDIARWTDTEPHNITTLIFRMKKDGLITAERNANDKRYLDIALTDKGRDAIVGAMPVAQEVMNRLMTSIGADDLHELERILAVIRKNAYEGIESLS